MNKAKLGANKNPHGKNYECKDPVVGGTGSVGRFQDG